MPKVKTTQPSPDRAKGQRSIDPLYIGRYIPPWAAPYWQNANFWRSWMRTLPVAEICEEALSNYVIALDWQLEPKDSNLRDELKDDIIYYTDLLEAGGDTENINVDWVRSNEWIMEDFQTIPFGAGVEVIREGDRPEGRVIKYLLLDGGTLFPTLNTKYPVGQKLEQSYSALGQSAAPSLNQVFFPAHAVNRVYMSPRTVISLEGWGMAPPEKIFLAMEMIRRGDLYYANLLVDTPEAGLLDLGDMERTTAEEWLKSFQELMGGINPFKVPVLYEHTTPVKFVPFGKPPTDLMYDRITSRYAAIIAAGYGLSLSDIGFSTSANGGETLSGSIRQERRTRRSGIAKAKKSLKYFYDRILPPTLQFKWIDLDDEMSVAIGRARLANSTSYNQMIDAGIITPEEARLQSIADGMFTIAMPEKIPESAVRVEQQPNERPGMLGAPVPASSGGTGEVRQSEISRVIDRMLALKDAQIRKLARGAVDPLTIDANTVFSDLDNSDWDLWSRWHDEVLWGNLREEIPEMTLSSIGNAKNRVMSIIAGENFFSLSSDDTEKIIDHLITPVTDLMKSYFMAKSEYAYEIGESQSLPETINVDQKLLLAFRSQIKDKISDTIELLAEYVTNAVVAGTRNTIIQLAKLDNTVDVSDNGYILRNIQSEFLKIRLRVLEKFSIMLEEVVNNILMESEDNE